MMRGEKFNPRPISLDHSTGLGGNFSTYAQTNSRPSALVRKKHSEGLGMASALRGNMVADQFPVVRQHQRGCWQTRRAS